MPYCSTCSKKALEAGQPAFRNSRTRPDQWGCTHPGSKRRYKTWDPGGVPALITTAGQTIDILINSLGNDIDSGGYCSPDIRRRLRLVLSTMGQLERVWRNKMLRTLTKICIYSTSFLPLLLYRSETWTLLAEDGRQAQVYHMTCQRSILGILWHDFVTHVDVQQRTCYKDTILFQTRPVKTYIAYTHFCTNIASKNYSWTF